MAKTQAFSWHGQHQPRIAALAQQLWEEIEKELRNDFKEPDLMKIQITQRDTIWIVAEGEAVDFSDEAYRSVGGRPQHVQQIGPTTGEAHEPKKERSKTDE